MACYNVFGSGNVPILALHNWFCDGSNYAPLLPYLDPQKFTFLLMDMRGYGAAKDIKGSYNLKEVIQDIIGLTNSLQWKEFHVVGHAMGSLVAQKLAIEHTDRVKSIIAISPIPASGSPKTEHLMSFLEEAALSNDTHALECIQALTNRRYSQYAAQKMVSKWRATSTPEARLSYLHMLSNSNFSLSAQGLKTPILAVFGEHDGDDGEAMLNKTFLKWYPNAQLECCRNVGHFSIQEAPIHLAGLIEKFTDKYPVKLDSQK